MTEKSWNFHTVNKTCFLLLIILKIWMILIDNFSSSLTDASTTDNMLRNKDDIICQECVQNSLTILFPLTWCECIFEIEIRILKIFYYQKVSNQSFCKLWSNNSHLRFYYFSLSSLVWLENASNLYPCHHTSWGFVQFPDYQFARFRVIVFLAWKLKST